MNIGIWVVGTLSKGSYTEIQFSKKQNAKCQNCLGPFCTYTPFCLS